MIIKIQNGDYLNFDYVIGLSIVLTTDPNYDQIKIYKIRALLINGQLLEIDEWKQKEEAERRLANLVKKINEDK